MGCCILGALIIGRWLYALRSIRRVVARFGLNAWQPFARSGTAPTSAVHQTIVVVVAAAEAILLAALIAHATSWPAAGAIWHAQALCISENTADADHSAHTSGLTR